MKKQNTQVEEYSILSKLFLLWTSKHVNYPSSHQISISDFQQLNPSQCSYEINKRWQNIWQNLLMQNTKKDRLKQSIKQTFKYEIITAMALGFLAFQIQALIPIFIYYFSKYIQEDQITIMDSLRYIIFLIILKLSKSLCHMQGQFRLRMLGNKIFSCLSLALTQKSLSQRKRGHNQAEQSKLMQFDCNRIITYPYARALAILQLYTSLLTLISMTILVGWNGFISCLVLYFCQTLRYMLAPIFKNYQKLVNKGTQQRILKSAEVINNIKYIKVNAYEEHFFYKLQNLRYRQISMFKFFLNLRLIPMFFVLGATRFSILIFAIYSMMNNIDLSASLIFSVLLFYNYMALNRFVDYYNTIDDAQISLKKIQEFLQSEDKDIQYAEIKQKQNLYKQQIDSSNVKSDIILMQDIVSQIASQQTQQYCIKTNKLSVKKGQFVILTGPYGSGKTTIINQILEEISNSEQYLGIKKGTISYANQKPWIMNDTVKNNILFGEEYNERKYWKSMKYSCLEKDLLLFTHGEQTMIGQGGSTLSGGQRARISLARALYKDADIYILDDVLSAVDANVSAFIFNQTLLKYLKGKTIILATHLLKYLSLANRIIRIQKFQIKQIITCDNFQQSQYLKIPLIKKISQQAQIVQTVKAVNGLKVKQDNLTYLDYLKLLIHKNGGCSYLAMISIYVIFAALTHSLGLKWLNIWMNSQEDKSYYLSMFIIIVLSGCFITLIYWIIQHNSSLYINMHYDMLKKIVMAPMSFFQTTPSSDIINKISVDLKKVDSIVMPNFRNMLYILAITLAFVINVVMTYITNGSYGMVAMFITTILLIFYYYIKFMEALRRLHKVQHQCEIPVYSNFSQIVSGYTTIRAFNKIQFMINKQSRYADNYTRVFRATIGIDVHFTFFITLLTTLITVIVFFKILLIEEHYSVDFFIIYNVFSFEKNILNFQTAFLEFVHNLKHLKYCEQILSIPQQKGYKLQLKRQIYEGDTNLQLKQMNNWIQNGSIRFNDFSIRYRPDLQPVLSKINFYIKQKEKIGIVGRTGSGKSTTFLCLLRILQDHEGNIQIDGKNIDDLDIQTLRSSFSTILQQHFIFGGSIRYNIDPIHKFSDQQIIKALELCGLWESIKTRDGLDTTVEENGDNFSAGQKQLINIARTLLNPKKIILIDEATANIDYKSDQILQRVIKQEFKDMTMITIAHRIQTILSSDRIIVLDKGRIVQFDSPQGLLNNQQSIFSQLHKQSSKNQHSL